MLLYFIGLVKPLQIMANIELRFLCESSETYSRIDRPDSDTISIEIVNPSENNKILSVWLDKSTAIKFAKTLRTEINKLEEVSNG